MRQLPLLLSNQSLPFYPFEVVKSKDYTQPPAAAIICGGFMDGEIYIL